MDNRTLGQMMLKMQQLDEYKPSPQEKQYASKNFFMEFFSWLEQQEGGE